MVISGHGIDPTYRGRGESPETFFVWRSREDAERPAAPDVTRGEYAR